MLHWLDLSESARRVWISAMNDLRGMDGWGTRCFELLGKECERVAPRLVEDMRLSRSLILIGIT